MQEVWTVAIRSENDPYFDTASTSTRAFNHRLASAFITSYWPFTDTPPMRVTDLQNDLSPLAWWILVLSAAVVVIAVVGTVMISAEFDFLPL